MNMMMVSNSSSTTLGVGSSFAACPVITRTRIKCCYSPNAKPRSTFSFGLFKSLNILSNPPRTTLIVTRLSSGLEASITDSNENSVPLANANITVEPGDENKIQLRVEFTGEQTQKIFDKVLTDLGRTAPPVPGFRMRKGGKSSKIPKSFLIQMLGEERVTKFAIQEMLNSTMADYARKENLDVNDMKISTTQTAEELKKSFKPGGEFGFNVIIEPENSQGSS